MVPRFLRALEAPDRITEGPFTLAIPVKGPSSLYAKGRKAPEMTRGEYSYYRPRFRGYIQKGPYSMPTTQKVTKPNPKAAQAPSAPPTASNGRKGPAKMTTQQKPTEVDTRILEAPIDRFTFENNFNVREYASKENKQHIAELAESLSLHGQRTPLIVRLPDDNSDKLVVVNGHMRLRAMKGLEWKHPVKYYLSDADSDKRVRTINLLTDQSVKPFSPLEKAHAIDKLLGIGMSGADIARTTMLGSEMTVSNYIKLWKVKDAVECVRQEKLSAYEAINLIRDIREKGRREGLTETKIDAKIAARFKNILEAVEKEPKEKKKAAPTPDYLKPEAAALWLEALVYFVTEEWTKDGLDSLKASVLQHMTTYRYDPADALKALQARDAQVASEETGE